MNAQRGRRAATTRSDEAHEPETTEDTTAEDQEPEPDPKHPAAYPPDPGEQSGAGLASSQDAGATNLLARLLTRTWFLDLHKKALEIDGGTHKVRAWACFMADFAFRALILFAILVIVFGVAWRALAPLPDLTIPKK